jgi:hypothetical protein
MDNNPYQVVKEFLQTSDDLTDEMRKDYLECLDGIAQGKVVDPDVMKEMNDLLDHQLELDEQEAIENNDTEAISAIASIYNARTELEKAIFMFYKPEDELQKEDPVKKDQDIQNLLNKISSIAGATA